MKTNERIKKVAGKLLETQCEIGVVQAGLVLIEKSVEELGNNFKKMIDLCDQFRT